MSYDKTATNVFNKYRSGLHNVGSYQVSGVPFITGSSTLGHNEEHKIEFPTVTKSITVMKLGAASQGKIYVHFNSKDTGNTISGKHFIELDSDEDSFDFQVKCKEIYISAPNDSNGDREYRLFASLTGIESGLMPTLTGPGVTE